MAKPASKKKGQQPQDKNIFSNKKVRNIAITLAIILLITIIPLIIVGFQNHCVKTLKISRELFLSAPERINLVNTSDNEPQYFTSKINGYTFFIPEKFTPSKIDYDSAEFREKSRSEGRYIVVHAERRTRTLSFYPKGITKWFLPKEMRYFMPMVLKSWAHPVRLLFKAQLFASEGITSKIFEANWDRNHIGYIFPTTGNEGYFGRIYRMDAPGTVEFLISDSVIPVTLRDWVNVAMKIQTPAFTEYDVTDDTDDVSLYSLDDAIEQASDPNQQAKTLSIGLNEFFRTKEAEWLIPVAIVMQERGFFPDVLDLIEQYKTGFNQDSKYLKIWNELIDNAVAKSITIEADPEQNLRELNVYCKNLTDLDIRQVTLNINVTSNLGVSQSFNVSLLSQSSLHSREEKQIRIKCPNDVSLTNTVSIDYRVTSLEFAK